MLYTLGHKKTYDGILAARERFIRVHGEPPMKKGRDLDYTGLLGAGDQYPDGYPGGSVWHTRAEAEAALAGDEVPDDYGVYGVEADWDEDTTNLQLNGEPLPDDVNWRYLLNDAVLVLLGEPVDERA